MREYKKQIDYNLEELVTLRRMGWSLNKLGQRYNRSHATIMYHCQRLGAFPIVSIQFKSATDPVRVPKQRVSKPPPIRILSKGDQYLDLVDEKVGPTKSYRQYKKESLLRPIEKRYEETYGRWR